MDIGHFWLLTVKVFHLSASFASPCRLVVKFSKSSPPRPFSLSPEALPTPTDELQEHLLQESGRSAGERRSPMSTALGESRPGLRART